MLIYGARMSNSERPGIQVEGNWTVEEIGNIGNLSNASSLTPNITHKLIQLLNLSHN